MVATSFPSLDLERMTFIWGPDSGKKYKYKLKEVSYVTGEETC